jgi:integrase
MHTVLESALTQAVKWELLGRNPADAVDPPRVERQRQTYDMPQTVSLIGTMRSTRISMPTILAALCGLRRGEIAALRWKAVDLAGAQLAVRESAEQTRDGVRIKEPKSGRARTVALSTTVVDELRQYRRRQAEELLKLGSRLSDETFVATHADGSPLQPIYITHEWVRQLTKSRLPRIRFHDLRHVHATHLLSCGVHPKVASERLGHSTVGDHPRSLQPRYAGDTGECRRESGRRLPKGTPVRLEISQDWRPHRWHKGAHFLLVHE